PVGHSAGRGYGSTELADSSTGTDYYPAGPDSGTGTYPRAESGHGTDTGHRVDFRTGSH
ncbi:hypothetical protein KI387_035980, partial [Taxus chinensis]